MVSFLRQSSGLSYKEDIKPAVTYKQPFYQMYIKTNIFLIIIYIYIYIYICIYNIYIYIYTHEHIISICPIFSVYELNINNEFLCFDVLVDDNEINFSISPYQKSTIKTKD